jgi:hypothetical protein
VHGAAALFDHAIAVGAAKNVSFEKKVSDLKIV